MPRDQNQQNQGNPRDEDIRDMQDKALETPGYEDDPHIESSNRAPNQNENSVEDEKSDVDK